MGGGATVVAKEQRFYHQTCEVGTTLWVLIIDSYCIAVGGWACLVFLVLSESHFAKQDYFVDGAVGVIVLNLEAEASVRVLFVDPT